MLFKTHTTDENRKVYNRVAGQVEGRSVDKITPVEHDRDHL